MRKIEAVQLPHLAAGKSFNALISESKALTSGSNISLRHDGTHRCSARRLICKTKQQRRGDMDELDRHADALGAALLVHQACNPF